MSSETPTLNTPAASVRIANLKAAIWANEAKGGGIRYGVTFSRSYRDADGQWHDSQSFGTVDLLALAKLADLAHSRILELKREPDGGE